MNIKALVIFDSLFGNTQKVAEIIAASIGNNTPALPVSRVSLSDLKSLDLLVVGSPTRNGRPTPAILKFLNEIPNNGLKGVKVAAFDTHFSADDHQNLLRFFITVIDYAAPQIYSLLLAKGGIKFTKSIGFIVGGVSGPLKLGEVEKAKTWLKPPVS